MKKLILFLIPFGLWAQTLKYDPKVMDRYEELGVIKGYSPDVLVVGDASKVQLQFVRALKGKARVFCYYDNPLEIDRIPYAPLIREFEKEADYFLVPSRCAAQSSAARNLQVVGNPDLDLFEEEVGTYDVTPGRVVYIGGYDTDYEEAFCHFVQKFRNHKGEVIVRPYPKTDGSLEKRFTEGTSIQVGEALSTAESLGRSELIVIYRSSLGTKASICGKRVLSIESDGTTQEVVHH